MEACRRCRNPVLEGEHVCVECGAALIDVTRDQPERPPSLPPPPPPPPTPAGSVSTGHSPVSAAPRTMPAGPGSRSMGWPSRPDAMPILEAETRCRICNCRLLADQLTCPSCGELLTLGPSTGVAWVAPARDDEPAPLGPFRRLGAVVALTRMTLAVLVVAAGAALLADVAQLTFLNAFIASPGDQALADRLAGSEQWQTTLDTVTLLVLVPTLTLLTLLTFQAYANLAGIGEHDQPWPDSWVVLGWMIPLVNLVLPKLVLDHLWRTSTSLDRESTPDRAEKPPLALHVAWAATVAAAVLSFAAYLVGETDLFVSPGVVDPAVFRWQAYLAIPAGAALLTAAVLAMSVVRELWDRQQLRRSQLLRD